MTTKRDDNKKPDTVPKKPVRQLAISDKDNQPLDHPTAKDPGEIHSMLSASANIAVGDECRGISPEKPIGATAYGIMDKGPDEACRAVEERGIPFRNTSPISFKSLSDEHYRVYEYPDGSNVRIIDPMYLNVSASGGHRVYTADGISHYIPSGWNHLWWEVREHCSHFAF